MSLTIPEKYKVQRIPWTKREKNFIQSNHYTQTVPHAVHYAFGLFDQDRLIGVCTFSPFSRNQAAIRYAGSIELSRMVVLDYAERNTESYFLGAAIKELKKIDQRLLAIVTYADPTEGHQGTLYRACNFISIGVTRASYHYLDQNGKRIHKKKIWNEAKKQNISEKKLSEKLGLIKIPEKPKKIFRYRLRDQAILGHIYKITNQINQKVYVGLTTQGVAVRYRRHLQDAKRGVKSPLYRDIRKLGEEVFSVQTIDSAKTYEELHNKEAFWISRLNAHIDCGGYNLSQGYDDFNYFIPDSVFERAFLLRKRGMSYDAISKKIKVHPDYINAVLCGRIRPHLLQQLEIRFGALDKARKISFQDKYKIFELKAKGYDTKYLAQQFNTSRAYILNLLKGKISPEVRKLWISENPTEKLFRDPLPVNEIVERYYAGDDVEVLKKQYGINFVQVFASRNKFDPKQKRYKVSEEVLKKCFELKSCGIKTKEIAERFGLSRNWLNQVFRGECRGDLLASMPKPKKNQRKANEVKIECEVACFFSIKAAADFVGVTPSGLLKNIRKGRPCRGYNFKKLK